MSQFFFLWTVWVKPCSICLGYIVKETKSSGPQLPLPAVWPSLAVFPGLLSLCVLLTAALSQERRYRHSVHACHLHIACLFKSEEDSVFRGITNCGLMKWCIFVKGIQTWREVHLAPQRWHFLGWRTVGGRLKRHEFHPWVGKISWRRKCYPLQDSCLGNPMDRRAWHAAVCVVTESGTWLSTPVAHRHAPVHLLCPGIQLVLLLSRAKECCPLFLFLSKLRGKWKNQSFNLRGELDREWSQTLLVRGTGRSCTVAPPLGHRMPH